MLDKIDDKTGTEYAAHPDRMYLVGTDGKIAYAGAKGPQGFKPDELEEAILVETGRKTGGQSNSSVDAPSGRPGGFGGARMLPVMIALDANQDGKISADELKNAAQALMTLDKDNDGKLTGNELRPSRGLMGQRRPGQRRGSGQ